jgi:hypothetical protein
MEPPENIEEARACCFSGQYLEGVMWNAEIGHARGSRLGVKHKEGGSQGARVKEHPVHTPDFIPAEDMSRQLSRRCSVGKTCKEYQFLMDSPLVTKNICFEFFSENS